MKQHLVKNWLWYSLGSAIVLLAIAYFYFRKESKLLDKAMLDAKPIGDEKAFDWLNSNDEFPLKLGSYGNRVKAVQYWLKNIGNQPMNYGIDGKFGKETETALLNYKNRNNISEAYWKTAQLEQYLTKI